MDPATGDGPAAPVLEKRRRQRRFPLQPSFPKMEEAALRCPVGQIKLWKGSAAGEKVARMEHPGFRDRSVVGVSGPRQRTRRAAGGRRELAGAPDALDPGVEDAIERA